MPATAPDDPTAAANRSGGVDRASLTSKVPGFRTEAVRLEWLWLVDDLVAAGTVVAPAVTGADAVEDWLRRASKARSAPAVMAVHYGYQPAAALLHAGVAFADLARFGAVMDLRPNSGSDLLVRVLEAVAAESPWCPLRDALGWALLASPYAGPHVEGSVAQAVRDWRAVRLDRFGWRYAAAGFTPAEARAGLDAGAFPEDDARVLAGLRGVPLPV